MVEETPTDTEAAEKDGWYPDGIVKRWHYFIKERPTVALCGWYWREYRVRGHAVPITRETVPFTARCLRCERILVAQLGIVSRSTK